MKFEQERNIFFLCQTTIFAAVCFFEIILASSIFILKLELTLTGLCVLLILLFFIVLSLAVFTMRRFMKKEEWLMPVILIQCLGLFGTLCSYTSYVGFMWLDTSWRAPSIWFYYISLGLSAVYVLVCWFRLKRAKMRNTEER